MIFKSFKVKSAFEKSYLNKGISNQLANTGFFYQNLMSSYGDEVLMYDSHLRTQNCRSFKQKFTAPPGSSAGLTPQSRIIPLRKFGNWTQWVWFGYHTIYRYCDELFVFYKYRTPLAFIKSLINSTMQKELQKI